MQVNDKEELEYSLKKLYEYVPVLESLSVVPVGFQNSEKGLCILNLLRKKTQKK